MTVIVNKCQRVDTGEKEYFPGDVISGLSKKDEQSLVNDGVCRYPDVVTQSAPPAPPKDDLPEGMEGLGSGNFELSNGDKVRGKAKAIEAQLKLNAEVEQPDGEPADEVDPDPGPLTELPE